MPLYEFEHPLTGEVFEVLRPMAQSADPFVAPDGVECKKLLSLPQIKIGDEKPDRYERKEADHNKKVKDPERARQLRKKKFGTEGISITKSPHYHKQKRIKAQGESQSIDKKDFIKQAAMNPNAVAAAKKVLGKS